MTSLDLHADVHAVYGILPWKHHVLTLLEYSTSLPRTPTHHAQSLIALSHLALYSTCSGVQPDPIKSQ